MADLPPYIVHTADVPEEEGHHPAPFDGEALSFSRDLGRAGGSVRIGMRHWAFQPGKR